jgi:hypothetical protein
VAPKDLRPGPAVVAGQQNPPAMSDRDEDRLFRVGFEIAAERDFGAALERGFDELGRRFGGGQDRDKKDIKHQKDGGVSLSRLFSCGCLHVLVPLVL